MLGQLVTVEIEASGGTVSGAANFIESYSHLFHLLKVSELGTIRDFDFLSAEVALDAAAENLLLAIEDFTTYSNCLEEAFTTLPVYKNTDFNPMYKKIATFDYENLIARKKLDPWRMGKVSTYLARGDVKGLFRHFVTEMKAIHVLLKKVRVNVSQELKPEMEDLRAMYQKYSVLMDMGYYSSLVFQEVKIGHAAETR